MRRKNILIAAVALILLSLGLMLEQFWLKVATEALIMMLLAISFSLLYGHTGLLSFGQGAYFGVGAYGFALAFTRLHLDFPLCLLVGVVSAGLWAAATGYLCVRLAGIYFAIMTVVVAQSTFFIIFQWYSLTGGDNGIQGLVPPDVISGTRGYYYFALAIVSAAFYAYYRLINSPFGLSLRCIRENMIRAKFVGIDEHKHRLKVFILSGLFAGLAGVLFAPFTRSVVPQMADWISSGKAVFMGILGGASYLLGPLVGAAAWVFLDAFVSGFTVHWPLIIGILVFVIVFFMPGGLMGLVHSYRVRAKARKRGSSGLLSDGTET
ncbi:MAG: branched-chain amino acid ABC transporter permease [Desulfomonile tiedjei]|uniref:Branched-chain amino acid ABC transporter permease n=1 Tax=Desulfomonile tiedjei TaxID=2358 RepID=A0A9D6V7P1_9BACT|nr:branched-chain amino acid ABC transporter permease [Desulfomonile tiedjei]